MAEHQDTGRTGEQLARVFLENRGYAIEAVNWRSGRWEIDLVASHRGTLHFVEVKTKAGGSIGYPEQRVDRLKLRYLKQAAERYLEAHPHWQFIQFDVLAVQMRPGRPEEYLFIEDIT